MSRVGENIKNVRVKKGMTQKQLGKKLGVSESYINEVETGKKVVGEDIIKRVSKILGEGLNDVNMSFEGEVYSEETTPERTNNKKETKNEINDVWDSAFSSVLKTIPIYKYDVSKIIETKQLPLIGNKVEGFSQDKVFYLEIQDEDMMGFRIYKGDLAFSVMSNQIENNTICLIEKDGERVIRQIRKLDNTKVLLLNNRGTLKTETVKVNDIKVIAKLIRLEIIL